MNPEAHRDQTTASASAVNLDRLREVCDGDTELEQELVDLFLADAKLYINNLADAVGREDAQAVYTIGHTLKGSSANIGAELLRATAHELESLGAANELGAANATLSELRDAYLETETIYRDYIGT